MTEQPTVGEVFQRANNNTSLDTVSKPGRNKGERGQQVELNLGLKNTNCLTDCIDGDIKTSTLGQTIFITQMGHTMEEIIDNSCTFENSRVGKKISNCMYIIYSPCGEKLGQYFVSRKSHPEHYRELEEDYGFIVNTIRDTYAVGDELKTTTGPNKLLQIRTKASKGIDGAYPPFVYKGKRLKDKYMAFYICSRFGKMLVRPPDN
jgi:hypothetical protein